MIKFFTYLTILLLPAYLLKIPLGNIGSVNFLDLLLAVSIFLQFIEIKKLYSKKEFCSFFKKHLFVFIFALLFIISFLISFFVNSSTKTFWDSLGMIKSFLILPILFSFGTLALTDKSFFKDWSLLKVIFTSIALQSLLGYLFIIKNWLTYDGRLSLFYDSPNHFAMLLAVGITIGSIFLLALAGKSFFLSEFEKILLILGVFSMLFCLFFTKSLGGFLAVFLSFFTLLLFFKFKKRALVLRIALCLFFIFSFLAIFNLGKVLSLINYSQEIPATEIDSRIVIYDVARNIALENLFSGVGPGNFQENYLSQQKNHAPFPQWAVPHAHNDFLHTLAEGGLAAFVFYIFFIFFIFIKIKNPLSGFFAAFLTLCFFGIVDVTIWKNDTSVLWWFFAMLLFQSKNNPIKRSVSSVCKK